jgi:CRISPR-associated protein (TIGR03984 family)
MKTPVEIKRIDLKPGHNVVEWLSNQAQEHELTHLLAFADDGIVWGRLANSRWVTAREIFSAVEEVQAQLTPHTLQKAHLFNLSIELRLWKQGPEWYYAWFTDASGQDMIEERYLLWGTCETPGELFSLMSEGEQGLLHAPPVNLAMGRRAALVIHHSLDYDQEGQAFIAHSRLVNLEPV